MSAHFLEFCALALALTSLAAVVWEIAVKDARLFGEIATDVRGMAQGRAHGATPRFSEKASADIFADRDLKKAA